MATFTLTELNNRSGEVMEAAHSGPVEITSRGKRKFVILTASEYDRLVARSVRRAHHVAAMTGAEREDFIAAMEAVAADAEAPDG